MDDIEIVIELLLFRGRWLIVVIGGVNVGQDSVNGDVAQSVFEKEELHRTGAHQPETGQEKKKTAKASKLSWITKKKRIQMNQVVLKGFKKKKSYR